MPRDHAPAPDDASPTADDLRRYRANLRDEVDGAALYRLLAAAEPDQNLREVYERLALSEDRHKALWVSKLQQAGETVPDYRPSFRVRALGWIARRFGTRVVMPIVTRMEMSAVDMYDNQPEAVAEGLPGDERSHARLFREIGRRGTAAAAGVDIARIEGRHRGTSGNALRAAVLGANDGLVSNLALVMGVAGAAPGREVVLLTGIAGLLAGALSMALGEWISVRSSTEQLQRQIAIERDELKFMPEEEEEELALIYQAKGMSQEDARRAAKSILSNPETALDTMVREELGLSPDEANSAWVAAGSSFMTFAVGAVLPVLPWLFVGGFWGVVFSAIASGIGLFAVGAAITLFTGLGVLFSGTRMLLFGLAAAAITFGIGSLIGTGAGV